jgi:hypothetical protein
MQMSGRDTSRWSATSLEVLLSAYVDGPERLVADAIVRGVESVRAAALEGGLVNNGLRQIAWPLLLSSGATDDKENAIRRTEKQDQETFRQIQLDVPRSVPKERTEEFEEFLVKYFREHADLCFFQGFADVAWTVYRVMNEGNSREEGLNGAHFVLSWLSRNTILRDAHRHNFETLYSYLPCITAIITQSDRELAKLWANDEIRQNHWAIGPMISLFTHGTLNDKVAEQILDAIIASENNVEFPLYLVAAIPLHHRIRDILIAEATDAASVHGILIDAMANMRDAEELIALAIRIQQRLSSKFILQSALNAGVAEDSQLIISAGERIRRSSLAMARKRSWKTLSFLGDITEVSIRARLPAFKDAAQSLQGFYS